MANGKIKLEISSSMDGRGFREANRNLARLAADAGRVDQALRQSILRAAAEEESFAARADKLCRARVGAYAGVAKAAEDSAAAVSRVSAGTKEATGSIAAMSRSAELLGSSMGEVGVGAVNLVKMFMQGGIWEVGAAAVSLIIRLFNKFGSAVKASRSDMEDLSKSTDRWLQSVRESSAASLQAVETSLSRRNDEIEAVKELIKSEIELRRQREISQGADEGEASARANRALADLDVDVAAERAAEALDAAEKRLEAAENAALRADSAKSTIAAERAKLKAEMQQMEKAAYDRNYAEVIYEPGFSGELQMRRIDPRKARSSARDAVDSMKEGEEWKGMAKRLETLDRQLSEAKKMARESRERVDDAKNRLKLAETTADSVINRGEAAELAARSKGLSVAAEAEEDAAEVQRRNHEQRMKDIREELAVRIAAEKQIQTAAQARWEKEFSLWRDPAKRDVEMDAREKDKEDRQRLMEQVRRYNASGRVREISALMRNGDEDAIEKRFETWRRGGYFAGMKRDEEQTIRAAAAYETRGQTEQNIQKIEQHTRDLAAKLEELVTMKG